jgi:hypothetical protein
MAWLKDSRLGCEIASKNGTLGVKGVSSAGLLPIDPLIDSGSPEPPQFAYLNTCDLASKHHALKGAGMYVQHGRGFVTIKQRLNS